MKKTTYFTLLVISILLFTSVICYADTGPKPTVNIEFTNMDDQPCYGTLLSLYDSTGPFSSWDGNDYHIENYDNVDIEIWKALGNYNDGDGYYFLQRVWKVSQTKLIDWTYCPPGDFKILLYYPDSNTFKISPAYQSYAFNTYYTVDMSNSTSTLTAQANYNYSTEILSFFTRVSVTLSVEMAIALLFGFVFKKKKLFIPIFIINLITQVLLNIGLNIVNFSQGFLMCLVCYFVFEIAVLLVEALFYCLWFKHICKENAPVGKLILYALVANTASFLVGCFLSFVLLIATEAINQGGFAF